MGYMKFAHLADLHLGGWREPKLQQLNLQAFKEAIAICKKNKVKFILIAGDLFDNPMPGIEILKETVSSLRELKESGVDCYVIPGSHDFSTSGKTFIDVMEKAGLCSNIAKFKEDTDSVTLEFLINHKFIVAGLPGKKSSLEQKMFEKLKMREVKEQIDKHNGKVRIFMLHTTLKENSPRELAFVESLDINKIPKGFDYYAAGHIHNAARIEKDGRIIIYPGPLFPNNFSELEKLKCGNFFIVEIDEETKQLKIEPQKIKPKDIACISLDLDSLTPEQATQKILKEIEKHNIEDKILLLRMQGCIEGKISSINFDAIQEKTNKCYAMLKNTNKLASSELKIEVKTRSSQVDEIEKEIISSYKQETSKDNENEASNDKFSHFTDSLMAVLDTEKQEGETNTTYENRISEEAIKILKITDKIK